MIYSVTVKPGSKKGPLVVANDCESSAHSANVQSAARPASAQAAACSVGTQSAACPANAQCGSFAARPASSVQHHNVASDNSGHELTVYLREKPIDGQANTALIAVLAKHFRVPKTAITIKSGARGRHKLVSISH